MNRKEKREQKRKEYEEYKKKYPISAQLDERMKGFACFGIIFVLILLGMAISMSLR